MRIQVKMKNGTYASIPCVHWHPPAENQIGMVGGGLWVSMSSIGRHVEKLNEYRRSISYPDMIASAKDYVEGIEFAEAPFSVYADSEQGEPWRHYGLCVREIPQYGDADFWNAR